MGDIIDLGDVRASNERIGQVLETVEDMREAAIAALAAAQSRRERCEACEELRAHAASLQRDLAVIATA